MTTIILCITLFICDLFSLIKKENYGLILQAGIEPFLDRPNSGMDSEKVLIVRKTAKSRPGCAGFFQFMKLGLQWFFSLEGKYWYWYSVIVNL